MRETIKSLAEGVWPREIDGIQGGLHGFFLEEYRRAFPGNMMVVVPTEKDAESLLSDIENDTAEAVLLPWWGSMPYRPVARGSLVFGQRAAALAKMTGDASTGNAGKRRIFVLTQRAFQTPVPPPEYIRSLIFTLKKGAGIDTSALAERLAGYGYVRVPRVTVRGEFTLRGEVLDIFMPGEDDAHRIVFDFDKIEQIRTFNPEDQTSTGTSETLRIYPVKEVVWTDELVESLRNKFRGEKLAGREDFPAERVPQGTEVLITELMIRKESEGEELFYPVVFDSAYSVQDYLHPEDTVLFLDYDRLENAQESFEREYTGLYRKAKMETAVPRPEELLFRFQDIEKKHERRLLFRTIRGTEAAGSGRIHFNCDPPRSFFGNITYLKEELAVLLKDNWQVFIYADSENQALRIQEVLKDFAITIIPQALSSGFGIPGLKILVIQENEIFGRRRRTPRSVKHAKSAVIDTFVELNPGDYVVHVNYGIGQFKGIERVKALGNERDYIKLEYAGEETVFIPIEQVNLVQRYIGNEGEAPRLDTLGSKSWENRKNRVKKSVEDIAQRLIDLYSRRKAARGFAFPPDSEWQASFDAAFPYEETDDQITCIADVKADMEKPVPMDRLICGDVGYGKTEVALRAAFKSVMGGKQVAFLAPTTILTEQHYETALERFGNFPVRIAQLSRFIPKPEQKKILEKVASGEIDILVGTHRIIQKDVKFKELGLLIIDEEQRFGVKDKERLKELKANVDSLSMSATPIPRTLHMSLLKIRDMSLLTTPPRNRHPIETVIDGYNDDRVAAAIRREVERGGQVFYLHNRIESLDEVRLRLEQLAPEMLIDTAHGQMSPTELEDIFRRFKMGGFHVLVSTTIIENGIDIPNVNTIIIDRADMYGVSQLYQLRGRVGRSDRKAYAYLFYPEGRALSEIAMKRLQVISDFTDLGSGFKIAMKDMEIRGAGNLLGREQSGDIYSVGFDMYLRLLEQAVQRLSDEHFEEEQEAYLELEYSGFIPDSYIANPQIKMEIYKKIAAVSAQDELERVYAELPDRFGPIPEEVQSLLALAEIRIICKRLSISSLKERQGQVQVEFSKVSKVSVDRVLRLIKESAGRVKLNPARPNVLILQTGTIGLREKSEFIREKLESLILADAG
ncbi:MAG: transcription-repair coupling factor [Spirochaetaceae bacterium]|jgi:transcription-repair coupling factor (superfamily II helicase)|nr:transcription-repair coupling factor [Spirochaetaceae bacterium]